MTGPKMPSSVSTGAAHQQVMEQMRPCLAASMYRSFLPATKGVQPGPLRIDLCVMQIFCTTLRRIIQKQLPGLDGQQMAMQGMDLCRD